MLLGRRRFLTGSLGATAVLLGGRTAAAAVAPPHRLSFYHIHTAEKLTVTYREHGELIPDAVAEIRARMIRQRDQANVSPACIAWVMAPGRWGPRDGDDGGGVSSAVIEHVLPRNNEVSRRAPGRATARQTLAANIDWVFILMALDSDFSASSTASFSFSVGTTHNATDGWKAGH